MQNEGCNIEGRVRVNKVAGNIQFSPGRSFVVNRPEVFQMVPYLQNANHYFGHWIHSMEIYDYDEDTWTRQNLPEHIRERLGISKSPLEEVYAHVSPLLLKFSTNAHMTTDRQRRVHVPVLPQSRQEHIQEP